MTALLDVPEIRLYAKRFSIDAYHRLTEGESTELLRGVILEKMSKSPLHFTTIETLRAILSGQIAPPFLLRQEGPLTLGDSEPEPDLAVVHGALSDFREVHPTTAELVIEVAVSSIEIDRVKALIYAEAGVPEYWIVQPLARLVEVHRQPARDGYQKREMVSPPAALASVSVPELRVDLSALFPE